MLSSLDVMLIMCPQFATSVQKCHQTIFW
ncbi:unnamed protein product [Medioppia subpectinata]|uniref:Uncharacterized protein n=1 Tax=Medioppia subpectinata TaxID=1979941 RepID=A0A7R9QKR6_9ACAR|nr:unnamed protein product [Medioppia subpectinata]CAG2122480.1 unnamed protein product [Medioppia subpectinata]